MHKIQALKYIKIAYYCVLTLKNKKKMKAAEFRANPGLLKHQSIPHISLYHISYTLLAHSNLTKNFFSLILLFIIFLGQG